MKKFVSIALALVMILSMATVAFAEGETTHPADVTSFTKTYYAPDSTTAPATNPTDTLTFAVAAMEGNPDASMITVGNNNTFAVDGTSNTYDIAINLPTYTKVGVYNYTVTENTTGATQGVTYVASSFDVQVLAYWNDAHTAIETDVQITSKDANGEKISGIVNYYGLGSLAVSKTVDGNLASTTQMFDVTVTFTAEEGKTVNSAITYVEGNATKTIAAGWSGDKEVSIQLKHDDTITFTNIPAGVTYTVEEASKHAEPDTSNGSDSTKGYTVTYTESDEAMAIANGDADTVAILNAKGENVETGISMDTIPYIVVLAVAVFGLVAVVANKRRAAEF